MAWFIIAVILLLIGGGISLGGLFSKDYKAACIGAGAAVAVVAVLLFFVAGFKEVPVKSVGVVTSFGKVEGFMGPGIHHTWPWKTVNILPETIQTTTFENGGSNGSNGSTAASPCLDVRIGGQQQACLDVTIQWQIKDSAADGLFRSYDTSGASVLTDITNAVVVRELKVAVNEVMGDYNPIADVAQNGQAGNSQFSGFGLAVKAAMVRDIGGQIDVRSVLIPFLHYDASTQARLNSIQQQFGNTAIAQQEIITNEAQAKANAAISRSVASSPNVLIAECLSIVQSAEKDSYQLPPGFNCIGSNTALALTGK